jgi:Fe2+ transport system protein FeoA
VSAVQAIPLSDLRPGARARLHEARLDAEACQWLCGLGLTHACDLRLCQHGEPCIIQVRSTRIALSRAVARGIFVVPHAEDAA